MAGQANAGYSGAGLSGSVGNGRTWTLQRNEAPHSFFMCHNLITLCLLCAWWFFWKKQTSSRQICPYTQREPKWAAWTSVKMRWQFLTIWQTWRWRYKQFSLVLRMFSDLVVTRFLMPGDKSSTDNLVYTTQHHDRKTKKIVPESSEISSFLLDTCQKEGRTVSDTVWWIKGVRAALHSQF